MGEMERVKPEEISKTKLRREGTGASAWGGGGGGGVVSEPSRGPRVPGVPVCPERTRRGSAVWCAHPFSGGGWLCALLLCFWLTF